MLRSIWLAMLITAAVFFFIAIILTLVWHIPTLLDELSGNKAKRRIKQMKEFNERNTISDSSTSDFLNSINESKVTPVSASGDLTSDISGGKSLKVNGQIVSRTVRLLVEQTSLCE